MPRLGAYLCLWREHSNVPQFLGRSCAVNELKTELKSSTQRCDDLEQYSRRNNIIIANVPESEVTSTEGQVVNILNDYVDEAITPNDIDRCPTSLLPLS